ncbi:MAG: hypothetical protein KF882_01935 [Bacteroidia bacterium]|nr:hypothetical protein [Bacteroidia bacterium]MCO5254006.1 hypothetical protein [Bacteroidota bacterium]
MKKTTILFLSVFLILSCKKDKNQEEVLAGVVSQGMEYHELNPALVTTLASRLINLDFNQDGIVDIVLGVAGSSGGYNSYINPMNVSLNIYDLNIEDYGDSFYIANATAKGFEYKDIINNEAGQWSSHVLQYKGVDISRYYYCLCCQYGDYWWRHGKDKYIGIRFTEGNDIFYGWIHVSVSGLDKITVHSYAYQKK